MKFTRQSSIYRGHVRRFRVGLILTGVIGVSVLAFGLVHWLGRPPVTKQANTAAGRNDERRADLTALAQGLQQYLATHSQLPVSVTAQGAEICSSQGTPCRAAGMIDLTFATGLTEALPAIPRDPIGSSGQFGTGFRLSHLPSGQFELTAERAEAGASLSVMVTPK